MRAALARRLALAVLGLVPLAPAQASAPALWQAGEVSLTTDGRALTLQTSSGRSETRLPQGVAIEELFELRSGALLSARSAPSPAEIPSGDLYLAIVDERGLHALPAPASRSEDGGDRVRWRENAVPLLDRSGNLEGLAWLEGADRQSYSLCSARWNGMAWGPTVTVAERAPGSQLALAAATLSDGSRLLVWSRYDGHDDEIVAIHEENGQFGPLLAVGGANETPDIQPTVVAVPGGALVAWARFDGHDYRVVTARFDRRSFGTATWIGPKGSTFPRLSRPEGVRASGDTLDAAAVWLDYSNAHPAGWGVAELDATGRLRRAGLLADVPSSRPALVVTTAGEPRLRWVDRETAVPLH